MTLSSTARADAIISPDHPFREHLKRVEVAGPHRAWTPADGPMPALFLGHGAPRTFENPRWMGELHDWARKMPRPTAILIVSAHWESAPLMLSSNGPTELVYDFGGFDPMYHRMRYDTPDAGNLARRLGKLLPGIENTGRGLDHGAWVPLKVMYPAADIPVLQLSIPTHDATRLMDLGRRLRPLREEGVLVIGSGFMTHGLPFLTRDMIERNKVPGWSADFDAWAADALARGDIDELAAFRDHAPGMPYAHPTVEHFVPIFVTLGAVADPTTPAITTIDGFNFGLAKRSFQVR
ncbi:class III extradiol ring-cleavage dioxygenase [Actinoplanes sp. NBRC 103695]|uniref:dioxygenase family protein n=1 Tax=Actinoplanes sp. NBRC 103695 TaxID=3032202 RepID=UPI0024A4B8E9|nr:class III extradiol ring-cleavage dioxygenase [Actinoplanes sp. NBRC 103695]GLY97202.1 dioxygenase [Actinoplanes sp. NBRC 103695]